MTATDEHIPTPPDLGITNPYWDAVRPLVRNQYSMVHKDTVTGMTIGDGPRDIAEMIRSGHQPSIHELLGFGDSFMMRAQLVAQYAWTVTDPWTVRFVADHARGRVIDPLAGTGYWGYLLAQLGVNVISTDAAPPRLGSKDNIWHADISQHVPVKPMDGRLSAIGYGKDRTLLLSWPPYATLDGYDIVRDYPGDRIIVIGEPRGGATGDASLFDELDLHWEKGAWHKPVQFQGFHDIVVVLERRPADKEKEPNLKE